MVIIINVILNLGYVRCNQNREICKIFQVKRIVSLITLIGS